jgi:hypothetical protein
LFGRITHNALYPHKQTSTYPDTKVQYFPRVREPKSQNLLPHNGTVHVTRTNLVRYLGRVYQYHGTSSPAVLSVVDREI